FIPNCPPTPKPMTMAGVAAASPQLDDNSTRKVQTRTVTVSASGNTQTSGPATSKNVSPIVQPMTVLTIRDMKAITAVCICGSVATITEMTAQIASASPRLRSSSQTAVVPMQILTA